MNTESITPIINTTTEEQKPDIVLPPIAKKTTYFQPATPGLTVKDINTMISTHLPYIREEHKGSWIRYEKEFHHWKIVTPPDSLQFICTELSIAEKECIEAHPPKKITITVKERVDHDGLTGLLITRKRQLVNDFPAGCSIWFDNDQRVWKLQGYSADNLDVAKNLFLDLESSCIQHLTNNNRKTHHNSKSQRHQHGSQLATNNTSGAA
jgi:hypothetical protein